MERVVREKSTQELLEEELVDIGQEKNRLRLFEPHRREQIDLLKEREQEIQGILQMEDESRMTLAQAGDRMEQGHLEPPLPRTLEEKITTDIKEDMAGYAGAELTPNARLHLVKQLQGLPPWKERD